MKVGTLSRWLGQIGRVNHCLGDFLLARDDHVGAEAPQVPDLRIAVGARENADAGVELAGNLGDPGFQHVNGDSVARNCR
jgi:hypothetical protein